MIDILKFLAEWTLLAFVAAVCWGIACRRFDQEERERQQDLE